MSTPAGRQDVAHSAVVFLPAGVGAPPRAGRIALTPAPGGPAPEGADAELTVVRPHGEAVYRTSVPARLLTIAEALPLLAAAGRDLRAHRAAACWGAAALHALHLVARGRLLPGLTEDGREAWRAGPLDAEDLAQLRGIAAAMPYEARAVPLEGRSSLELPDAEGLVRGFLDAVADTLPRTPGAPAAAGHAAYATADPQGVRLPAAAGWVAEVAAGADAGVKISLRLHLSAHELYEPDARPAAVALQVHSLADPTLLSDAVGLWDGSAAGAFGPRARVDTVLALRRAARVWPPLARLLDQSVPDTLVLQDDELQEILGPAARRLEAAGIKVHWPRSLVRDLTADAVVRPGPGTASNETSFFDAEQLLEFRWQVSLGGLPLTEREMDELAEAHRPMVRLRDQWVVVDPELVRKVRKRALGYLDPVEALAVALTGEAEVDGEQVPVRPTGTLAEIRKGLALEGEPLTQQPPGLAATLREYQLRGLAWLDRMTRLGLGGCLTDDMGLGKTITVIALQLRRRPSAPVLVVCPASLLGNWQREIERFAPGVPVHRYHGSGRSLDGASASGGFVLTTYGTMRTSAPELAGVPWDLVVADEAQHVKNPYSAAAKALRTIPSRARVALTGTPVENNLSELWAILDWTTPGLLGGLKNFRARHARAIESEGDPDAAERLARLVRPFVLRRRKADPGIAPELPPKTETDHPVALTREQAVLYEAVVREALDEIASAEGTMARRGLVMKLLTSLKQICNHPAQYLREPDGLLAARSGKLQLLDELLETIVAEDGAVLVFTQYVTMARLLERHLAARGIPSQLLHGGTPVLERDAMVARFQNGEVPVFLLSLKAGGTGLNLTRAGHVIHYDRWWNPAVEEQATDRAYRIGQTQPVQVHRLITEGTVEDRIDELLITKRSLADAILGAGGGETALTELSDADLAELLALRAGPDSGEGDL
ncbi:DEAD/DEAH box helicase [Streptomyces sp. A7024]|uniref:DEAD/DEAH box helicase n=1 Tax=Streptomyces coryli TaxID=1128680 RepID=A0A6G4UE73_9ACTN|nr:DEAD/DEAH box helicase [Streptomyces coryli]NGN69707.1 DEAD/DEAH box helicase [Streptomyces coryli]